MPSNKVRKMKFATKVIHVGGAPDKETGSICAPIYQTTTYAQTKPGEHQGYEYSRTHNPTRTRLEENLASLEGAKHAVVTSSGVSLTTLIMHALPTKSKIICSSDVYGGTYRLFSTVFNDLHDFLFVDTTDIKALEKLIKSVKPQAIWLETPSNPTLKITDLKKISAITKKNKVMTIVDNTFMSPYFQRPLELGIDVVAHSMSKYINGHSDVIGGAMMTNNKSFYQKVLKLQNSMGPTQSPFDSWLVLRGIKTLAIRMEQHQKNALKIAKWLENQPKVEKVLYPGLKSHPQNKLAKQQMSGFGGVVSFYLLGNLKSTHKLLKKLKLFALAESLGGVESQVGHPASMSHASVPKELREVQGISDNLIRLSVGIEDYDDLIADLESALDSIQ